MASNTDRSEFLTQQWVRDANKIREEFRSEGRTMKLKKITINIVVSNCPASVASDPSDATVDAHLDTTSGEPVIELGLLPKAELTLHAPYEIAKSIFINNEFAKAMEAMQLGRIKVDGSMFKMLGLASLAHDKDAKELAERIRAITL